MKGLFLRSGNLQKTYRSDVSLLRTPTRRLVIAGTLLLVIALPELLSPTNLSIADAAWIAVVGAISLNLLTGYAGQVSLGQAAFLAIGAYTAVFTMRSLGAGMWLGIPLAGVVSAVVGLIVGLPSLRFRGFYLALTTLGLQFIAGYLLLQYQVNNGGLEGFTLPTQSIGPLALTTDTRWYYFLAVIAIVVILISVNLVRSRTGRAWMAIRDRDIAASIVGVNVARYKLLAFVVSAFLAGVAGALGAYYTGGVSIETFSLSLAITYIAMIIVGGLGSTAGAVIGAVLITALPFWINDLVQALPQSWPVIQKLQLSIFALQTAVFGLIIVAFLVFEPRGIIAIWGRFKAWALLWPYQRSHLAGDDES
jgi:branched-chain amino acid transport system permease protein